MRKILITGCNGLIGKSLVEKLKQENDAELFGLSRHTNQDLKIVSIDLSKDWSASELPEQMDVIIHLAQSEKFREFPEAVQDVFNVNTASTLKLLDYARKAGVKKFIYASSGGIYGNSDTGFLEDDIITNTHDLGFYLGTKFCSEILAMNYANYFDIDILRFFFVYGKDQNAGMLIPRLVNNVINGNPITLNSDMGIKINPIHVSDASAAITKAINLKGSNKFNISGSEIFTLREICELIGNKCGRKPKFTIMDAEPKNLIGDNSKMCKILVEPKVKFNEGINEIIEKYASKI